MSSGETSSVSGRASFRTASSPSQWWPDHDELLAVPRFCRGRATGVAAVGIEHRGGTPIEYSSDCQRECFVTVLSTIRTETQHTRQKRVGIAHLVRCGLQEQLTFNQLGYRRCSRYHRDRVFIKRSNRTFFSVSATERGTTRTPRISPTRSALAGRMPGAFTTFTAMCGSGARTPGTGVTRELRRTARPGWTATRNVVVSAEGATTRPKLCGLPAVRTSTPLTADGFLALAPPQGLHRTNEPNGQ